MSLSWLCAVSHCWGTAVLEHWLYKSTSETWTKPTCQVSNTHTHTHKACAPWGLCDVHSQSGVHVPFPVPAELFWELRVHAEAVIIFIRAGGRHLHSNWTLIALQSQGHFIIIFLQTAHVTVSTFPLTAFPRIPFFIIIILFTYLLFYSFYSSFFVKHWENGWRKNRFT